MLRVGSMRLEGDLERSVRGKGWRVISRKEQGEAFTRPQGEQSVPSCVLDTSPGGSEPLRVGTTHAFSSIVSRAEKKA